eukprot:CAMPEP_0174255942 /NCGR_PEP_ID=MMETSP0439-20130205/5215_1 /TAXON_ID=0 /ORGANISM="Stereomyxa ramosa, Strain Chinc5" /LENGTH=381 /DNA_ID=CAMNT_0015338331 /DNA_START=1014 /DNA_END=2162 /DNA_ORIENTATION=-
MEPIEPYVQNSSTTGLINKKERKNNRKNSNDNNDKNNLTPAHRNSGGKCIPEQFQEKDVIDLEKELTETVKNSAENNPETKELCTEQWKEALKHAEHPINPNTDVKTGDVVASIEDLDRCGKEDNNKPEDLSGILIDVEEELNFGVSCLKEEAPQETQKKEQPKEEQPEEQNKAQTEENVQMVFDHKAQQEQKERAAQELEQEEESVVEQQHQEDVLEEQSVQEDQEEQLLEGKQKKNQMQQEHIETQSNQQEAQEIQIEENELLLEDTQHQQETQQQHQQESQQQHQQNKHKMPMQLGGIEQSIDNKQMELKNILEPQESQQDQEEMQAELLKLKQQEKEKVQQQADQEAPLNDSGTERDQDIQGNKRKQEVKTQRQSKK